MAMLISCLHRAPWSVIIDKIGLGLESSDVHKEASAMLKV